jgi:uncharacterized protein YndB with AHSA1/START domain
MTAEPERFLRLTRRFAASPERVFDAWLDPLLVRQWLFAMPGDQGHTAQLDARPGGQWTITARRGGMDYTATGEYLEIDRPRRLVLTFAMPQFSPNSDTLTVEIVPDGAGCRLTLTQSGVDIAAEMRMLPPGVKGGSEQGWETMLDTLARALA